MPPPETNGDPLQLLRLTPKPEVTTVWGLGDWPHPSISHTFNPYLDLCWLELATRPQDSPPTHNCQDALPNHTTPCSQSF